MKYKYQRELAAAVGDLARLLSRAETDHKRVGHRIYVIRDVGHGLKVGTSYIGQLHARVKAIQAGNPRPLAIVLHCRGGHVSEKALHHYLGRQAKCPGGGSEWFREDSMPAILRAVYALGDVQSCDCPVAAFPEQFAALRELARTQQFNPYDRVRSMYNAGCGRVRFGPPDAADQH